MAIIDKSAVLDAPGDDKPVGNLIWLEDANLLHAIGIDMKIGTVEEVLEDGSLVVKLFPEPLYAPPTRKV